MHIFLSGASGSLGTKISPVLTSKGHELHPIDLRKSNLQDPEESKRRDSIFLHLATFNSFMTPQQINSEVAMLENALSFSRKMNVNHFLFFSSIKVLDLLEANKSALPYKILSEADAYSIAKLNCEKILEKNVSYFDSATVVRLAPVLIKTRKSNLTSLLNLCDWLPIIPLLPMGNANKRSFLSLTNLISFLDFYLNNPGIGFNAINLADPTPISTNELMISYVKNKNESKYIINLPKIFEKFFLYFPLLGNKILALYKDSYIENLSSKDITHTFSTNETKILIERDGINY